MKKLMKMVLSAWCLVLGAEAGTAAELPAGYTAVEWIESTKGGGQFIDTDYTANAQTKVVFDALVPERGTGQQADDFGVLFGSRTMNEWKLKAFALQMCGGNNGRNCVRFVYNGDYRQDGDKPFSFGERVTVTCDGQHVEWKGSKAASVEFSAGALEHSKSTLYIFADNTVSGEDGAKNPDGMNPSVMRLYSFKITEDEAVKRDFVPCIRTSDGAVGLYDLAANEAGNAFYANDGVGMFGIPPDAFCTVTIGDHPYMTAAWTSGDGSVTNPIAGGTFEVFKGTEGVKVIFTPEDRYSLDRTEFALQSPLAGDYALTAEDLPTATYLYARVTVGELPAHVTSAAWTSGDGSETNAIAGGAFEVLKGSKNVKVVFTPEPLYLLDKAEFALSSPLTDDYALTEDDLPTATYFGVKVTVDELPAHVTAAAWTSGDGSVTNAITGGAFEVLKGSENVKVIFSADPGYSFAEGAVVAEVVVGLVDAACTVTAPEAWTSEIETFGRGWYVAAENGAYIDTGLKARSNTRIVADMQALDLTAQCGFFGTIGGGMNLAAYINGWNPGQFATCLGKDKDYTASGVTADTARHLFVLDANNGGSFAIDGTNASCRANNVTADSESTYRILVGARNQEGTAGTMNCRIFTFQIDEGGTSVRNFVPARTKDDRQAIGLYDTVSSTFYVPCGGTLTLGYDENTQIVVTVGELPAHVTAAWTSGDGSVTNAINGGSFKVRIDTENVKLIFTPEPLYILDKAEVALQSPLIDDYTLTEDDLPTAAYFGVKVTVGELPAHVTDAAWTSGDGSETNAITGGVFEVLKGTENVKVVFTPEDRYSLDKTEVALQSPLAGDYALTAEDLPTATYLYARVTVGELPAHVTSAAWTSGDGSETNAIAGGAFEVLKGTENVKVVFAPEDRYGLDKTEFVIPSPLTDDYALTTDDLPKATYLYVQVTVGELPAHVTAAWTSGDGSETNAIAGGAFEVLKGSKNVMVIFAIDPEYEVVGGKPVHGIGTVNEDCALEFSDLPQLAHRRVEYVDADGQLRTNDTFTIVTETTAKLENGWYLVEGTIERGGIDVAGNCTANLILADGASLTVQGADKGAGIDVRPSETLNIYGQRGGTGRLTAKGGASGAGIGGGDSGAGGTVMVNGGTVTATGGRYGAGIGGGCNGADGAVTIINGRLDIKAGDGASVIGAGLAGDSQGKVEISGGIFSWKPNDEWIVDPSLMFMSNPDATTSKDYPWAVLPCARVTFGRPLEHMTAVWTSGDGTVTNAISGTTFGVLKGTAGVKVIFTPDDSYELDITEYVFAEPVDDDFTIPSDDLPTAKINKYAITYDYTPGTGPAMSNATTYTISTEVQTIHLTAPTPARGYDFTGFTLKENRDGVTFNDMTNMVIAANAVDPISVKANYQVITYTISYAMDGGTAPRGSPTSYTVNDPINVGEQAKKEGHNFTGWTWEGQSTPRKNVSIPVGHVGNITFTAHWKIREFVQEFKKNIDAEVSNLPAVTNVPWHTKLIRPATDPSCEGYRFDGWYEDEHCTVAFDFNQLIEAAHFIYAKWVELLDVPVDGDLDDNGRKNAAALVDAIMKAGVDVNNWVESVYGTSGKIPAAKLNATTSANVALAVANDIPVTVNEPTFAVSASMVTAESGNVAAFEFTLMDGGDPIEIKNLTQRVKAMVRYTSSLGVAEFAQATEVQVEVGLTATGGKIKAEFKKQTGVNTGFMKAEPQPAR